MTIDVPPERDAVTKPSLAYCSEAWSAVCESQAVIEFDVAGNVVWANDEFLGIVGYRRECLIGKHHRVLCAPEYASSLEYIDFWSKLKQGQFDRGTYPRRRQDGRELWLGATYSPMLRDGRVHRILKVATDLTDKVMLERALAERRTALTETLDDLAGIVASISSIAGQTNLVAINATIQAARGGDGGAFAVVANEMKRLALDMKSATDLAAKLAGRHRRHR